MTDLLEKAVVKARSLPPSLQDEIARVIFAYSGDDQGPIELSPEELADLDESDAEIERGEFATDEQMQAIWTKKYL